mmetsp:Transcript_8813/g.20045  ORF Transcript_8813/g.20045 Transcript_8813/m.20045 type:complete len:85 (-) Transcript_8813:37-291(-)
MSLRISATETRLQGAFSVTSVPETTLNICCVVFVRKIGKIPGGTSASPILQLPCQILIRCGYNPTSIRLRSYGNVHPFSKLHLE